MTEQTAPRPNFAVVLLTVAGATFLAMLDSTVTNLVIPALHKDFPSAAVSDLSWVITAYIVLFAALLASAGRLADVVGRRNIFLGGVAIFTLMSLLSALAPNLGVLIVARAVQGVGAAAMIPAALAILLLDGPPERRASAIGTWSAASALAAAVGPSVGGLLVDWLGWRSVFYINVPIGIVMLISAVRVLPRQASNPGRALPDPLGTIVLTVGIGALTLGLTEGASWDWTDPKTLACLVGGLLLTVFAVWRSTRHPAPAVETQLWGNRTYLMTNIVSLFYGMAQYPWLLGTVLYITSAWQYGEMRAGFAMTPGAIFASAAALLAGRATGRLRGPRVATLIGLTGFLIGGVWMVLAVDTTPAFLTLLLPVSFLAGFGMGGITFGTSMAAAMSAPPIRFAGASGMNTMARQFGGALGVAALAVILESSTSDGVDAFRQVYLFCTVLVVIAIAVTYLGMRFTPPPAPAATPAAAPVARTAPADTRAEPVTAGESAGK